MKILEVWRRKWRDRRERKERPEETIEGEEVLVIVYGKGDNSKSALLETLRGPGVRPPDVRS